MPKKCATQQKVDGAAVSITLDRSQGGLLSLPVTSCKCTTKSWRVILERELSKYQKNPKQESKH